MLFYKCRVAFAEQQECQMLAISEVGFCCKIPNSVVLITPLFMRETWGMSEKSQIAIQFDEYIQERKFCSQLSPTTIRGYIAVFRLFLNVMPEVCDFDALTPAMLVEFFRRLEMRERVLSKRTVKTGIKNSTIITYWSKLNSFFQWLHGKSVIQKNPLAQIKPPQPIYEDVKALSEDNIRKMYSATTLHSPNTLVLRRDTAMLSLLLFCGLRRGEFISLEVRDIDFERRLLTVRGSTSKSKKIRHIPIHPTLMLHLRDYISERNKRKYKTQYLIVSSGSDMGLSRHGLKHWVQSTSKKSGVKFHLHQMRHAFACNLARKDVNAVKIQKLLGHSNLNMTMTYLRSISTEDLQDDINKLSI